MSRRKRARANSLPGIVAFLDSLLQADTCAMPETIPLAGPVWNRADGQRFLIIRGR